MKRMQLLEDKTGSSHLIEIVGIDKSFGDVRVLSDIIFTCVTTNSSHCWDPPAAASPRRSGSWRD